MTAPAVVVAGVLAVLPWLGRRTAVRLVDARLPRGAGAPSSAGRGVRAAPDAPARRGGSAPRPVAGGSRWPHLVLRSSARPARADPALLLDLVAVALAAGAPVPTALSAVGAAWPGADGEALSRAARSLVLGAPWDVAWTGAGGAARAVAEGLRPAWSAGASPVPLLRSAADRLRSRRRAEIRAAAGRLGVRLVVPLGLCYLPAFVLVGLVPVVVSLGAGLLG